MSDEDLKILLDQISHSLADGSINGRDMEFLMDTEGRLMKFGVRTDIKDKQRFWLDDIFARTGAHRDPRGRL